MTAIVWGPRSSPRRDSFWLKPPVLAGDPVGVRAFAQPPGSDWIDPTKGVPLTVAFFRDRAEATFVLPSPPPRFIAIDIDLRLEVDGVRASGLRLRQLCSVGAHGVLMPAKYVRRDVAVTVVPNAGVTIADRPAVELVGAHPLLSFTTAGVRVDAEFLDVTELWWGLRAKRPRTGVANLGDWYTHPALGGQPDRLRVLAATTPGKGPMVWMVWASKAAAADAQKVQPLLFLIAPAWINGVMKFSYTLDAAGFVTAANDRAPMYTVGRFLLSPVPSGRIAAVGRVSPTLPADALWQLANEVLRDMVPNLPRKPPGILWPERLWGSGADAARAMLPLNDDLGHRPAAHEAAADAGGKPLLLVYPVSPNVATPYASVMAPGLAQRMKSLVGTMFGMGAVATASTGAPATDDLILCGHSSGNLEVWLALEANGADIAKCVTFDAAAATVPWANTSHIKTGVARRAGKAFTLVMVVSPNSGDLRALPGRVATVKDAMRANRSAKAVVLPPLADMEQFWDPTRIRPASLTTKNPVLRSMFTKWTDKEVADAAAHPRDWSFLFFHEFTAYGGRSLTRTFFSEALDL